MNYINSTLEAIGNTPLLKLNRITRNIDANIFVKLEHLNPSGSYKDRMALSMIEAAEKGLTWNEKKLEPGGIVCDASAGNTAPALAFVCAVKGYNARFCTYKTMLVGDSARLKITGAFGPDVYMCPVPSQEILDKCNNEKERNYSYIIAGKKHMYEEEKNNENVVWVDQIYNKYNYIGQMQMGNEIYEQLDGKIDAWGCSIGSAGCILGVTLALKEKGVNPWIFGVTPDSHILGSDISTDIVGRKKGKPEIMKKFIDLMDLEKWNKEKSLVEIFHEKGYPNEYYSVSNENAREMANKLCTEEGIYCGMSSGANVYAALKVAKKMDKNQNIVTVIVDRRDRYLGEYPNDIYVV
jgi:cystathionine beta-synthase